MAHTDRDTRETLNFFQQELKNFQEIAEQIKPSSGEMPDIKGIDIYGEVLPLNQVIGGDHIIYVDFNKRYDLNRRIQEAKESGNTQIVKKLKRNRKRAGILIADVAGHNITDGLLAAMLHQAFLIGVLYELNQNGEITSELFEMINTRFFRSSSLKKFITLIYGEISEKGNFQFLNAGHVPPIVFSREYNKLVQISDKRVINVQPIGTLPSRDDIDATRNLSRLGYKRRYNTGEINLMNQGDILILHTDGLTDHVNMNEEPYFPAGIEKKLKEVKDLPAKKIFNNIKKDMLVFGTPSDDISMVIIKKV